MGQSEVVVVFQTSSPETENSRRLVELLSCMINDSGVDQNSDHRRCAKCNEVDEVRRTAVVENGLWPASVAILKVIRCLTGSQWSRLA